MLGPCARAQATARARRILTCARAPPRPSSPPADFVDLPAAYAELRYSNILCGVIRGALEMVSLRVTCAFVKDALAGDDTTEIRVALQEVLSEGAGEAYEDE